MLIPPINHSLLGTKLNFLYLKGHFKGLGKQVVAITGTACHWRTQSSNSQHNSKYKCIKHVQKWRSFPYNPMGILLSFTREITKLKLGFCCVLWAAPQFFVCTS